MITVYTKSTCAPCRTLKSWLKDRGLKFEEKSVDDPATMAELQYRTGLMSVPVMFIDNEMVMDGFSPRKLQLLFN